MTKSDTMDKIIKKEQMQKDIKRKAHWRREEDCKNIHQVLMRRPTISPQSIQTDINPPIQRMSSGVDHMGFLNDQDYLPFPDLISDIASRLPDYPEKPRLDLHFSKSYLVPRFILYGQETQNIISKIMKEVRRGKK